MAGTAFGQPDCDCAAKASESTNKKIRRRIIEIRMRCAVCGLSPLQSILKRLRKLDDNLPDMGSGLHECESILYRVWSKEVNWGYGFDLSLREKFNYGGQQSEDCQRDQLNIWGFERSPIDDPRLLSNNLIKINAAVAAVSNKNVHVELSSTKDVSFSNFDHRAKLGDAAPGFMEQLTRERVEGQVNTAPFSFPHNSVNKRGVS
jgi:hypothetical protein